MSIRVRRRSDGTRVYQVRVPPFPAVTLPTRAAADRIELELKLKRRLGPLYEERPHTLGEELEGFIKRKEASGRLRPRGLEWYRQSLRAWEPFRGRLVSTLRRAELEDHVLARAAAKPVAARNELQVVKQALRQADSRGQRIDPAIFEIPPVVSRPREGRALTAQELHELASWFPEYVRRLVLVAGFVGARQHFWFELTDDLVDVAAGRLTIPASLAKNRKPQLVHLSPTETTLLREQLLVRPPGTRLVFPTRQGRKWTRHHFRDRVWSHAVAAAAAADRETKGEASSVFDGFTFHLLRHTAGSLMAFAGIDPAVAALRLGHSDGGALFLRRYRHLYEPEARRQAARFEAFVQTQLAAVDGAAMDESGTRAPQDRFPPSGRTWDRTRDLPRVKRALSR
jgi:integrase